MPKWMVRAFTAEEARKIVLLNLQSDLYRDFYCRGYAATGGNDVRLEDQEAAAFARKLHLANRGRGYSEGEPWRIKEVRKSDFIVFQDGLEMRAKTADLPRRTRLLKPKMKSSLRLTQGIFEGSPGFYLAVGDKDLPTSKSRPLLRFYWNLSPAGAAPFVRTATTLLNQVKIPFRVKVANHPGRFNRCDTGVLYLPDRNSAEVQDFLEKILISVAPYLRLGTPALTKPLARGLSWAEDAAGESFGFSRCILIADALLRACEAGKRKLTDRMSVVEQRFREDGITIQTPYLSPGSRNAHKFENFDDPSPLSSPPATGAQPLPSDEGRFLRAAHEIGCKIIRDAFWQRNRCNWLGLESVPPGMNSRLRSGAFRPLGPDLYSGTSGVALFLAQLHAATGDASARRAALGAMRHSLSQIETIPRSARLSLYHGWIGVTLAAAQVGLATKNEEFTERAARLLKQLLRGTTVIRDTGILRGGAGAIIGLLDLRRTLDDGALLDSAVHFGGVLTKVVNRIGPRPLPCGFAEGFSGIAYALLELFKATGNTKYRHAAIRALAREDTRLRQERTASPHVSWRRRSHGEKTVKVLREASWSHGAPGIALARVRAFEVLGDPRFKISAMPEIRSTCRTVENWRWVARGSLSLARGIAGNAEILLYACRVFGQELEAERAEALQFCRETAMNWMTKASKSNWEGQTGHTVNLMFGLAGIGYFHLRLGNAGIVCPLTLG
jgi:hypothetical protein